VFVYAAILAVLLGWRVVQWWSKKQKKQPSTRKDGEMRLKV
jgi:DMSO/TMAO reductase YedYZ heme-binding membrane subunit